MYKRQDSYITEIRSEMDYTLGRWNNVMRALPVMDFLTSDVRRRIKVRGFARRGRVPTTHGAFNNVEFKFWLPSFQDPLLDGRTKRLVEAQLAAGRRQGTEAADEIDQERKILQSSFDRKLARARGADEVRQLRKVYSAHVRERAWELRGVGGAFDADPLLEHWERQAQQRVVDISLRHSGVLAAKRSATKWLGSLFSRWL